MQVEGETWQTQTKCTWQSTPHNPCTPPFPREVTPWPSAAWASTREAPGISSLLHAPHEYTSLGTVLPFHFGPRRYEGIKRKRLVLYCRIRLRASFLSRVVCLSPLAMILLTGELFSNNLYACCCWCFASLVFSLADFPLLPSQLSFGLTPSFTPSPWTRFR